MVVQRKLPVNFLSKDIALFKNELIKEIVEVKSRKINWALLNSHTQVLLFQSKKKSKEQSQTQFQKISINDLFQIVVKRNISVIKLDCALVTDGWSKGYFHWMLDVLPRLLKLKVEQPTTKVLLPIGFWSGYYKDCLMIIGYREEDFIFFKSKYVFSKSLYYTGHVLLTGNYNEESINKLRTIFLKSITDIDSEKGKHIYISRNKTSRRRLVNEDELFPILESFGIQIIYAEELTFEEQIRLFSKVSILIGVHGAGLTNMLFMAPNTKVLELRFENDTINNCYFSLASALNINYYYCLGSSQNSDLYIKENNFRDILNEIMSI